MRTTRYGNADVPVHEREWTAAERQPYRKTYSLKPGQHWKDAETTELQWEHYPTRSDGTFVPVGALIAEELLHEGATIAVFIEMWGGVVLVGSDLICIPAEGPLGELLDKLRVANGGSLAGLPDVIAIFPDGRVAMREAKNIAAKDRLGPKQHAFADVARRVLGEKLNLGVVE